MSGSLISLQTLRIRPSVQFALEEISFICWDHWRVLVTVMPKSLISLTVASGDPLRWYSRFVGVFFLEIFKALHLGMLRHISQVSLQIESCVRSCWNENLSDGFSIILNSLESSANMATLESCLIHWGMSYRQGKAEGPILSLAEHRTRLVTSRNRCLVVLLVDTYQKDSSQNQFICCPDIPNRDSLFSKAQWGTLSNALAKSK